MGKQNGRTIAEQQKREKQQKILDKGQKPKRKVGKLKTKRGILLQIPDGYSQFKSKVHVGASIDTVFEYINNGFAVFALIPGAKIPFKGSHGFLDAVGYDDIAANQYVWWLCNPTTRETGRIPTNFGVALGNVSDDIAVIDLDGHTGKCSLFEIEQCGCPMPKTVVSESPNDGEHWYYYDPHKQLKEGVNIMPKMDVRSDGGYVVGVGSSLIYGYDGVFESSTGKFIGWAGNLPPYDPTDAESHFIYRAKPYKFKDGHSFADVNIAEVPERFYQTVVFCNHHNSAFKKRFAKLPSLTKQRYVDAWYAQYLKREEDKQKIRDQRELARPAGIMPKIEKDMRKLMANVDKTVSVMNRNADSAIHRNVTYFAPTADFLVNWYHNKYGKDITKMFDHDGRNCAATSMYGKWWQMVGSDPNRMEEFYATAEAVNAIFGEPLPEDENTRTVDSVSSYDNRITACGLASLSAPSKPFRKPKPKNGVTANSPNAKMLMQLVADMVKDECIQRSQASELKQEEVDVVSYDDLYRLVLIPFLQEVLGIKYETPTDIPLTLRETFLALLRHAYGWGAASRSHKLHARPGYQVGYRLVVSPKKADMEHLLSPLSYMKWLESGTRAANLRYKIASIEAKGIDIHVPNEVSVNETGRRRHLRFNQWQDACCRRVIEYMRWRFGKEVAMLDLTVA